MFLKSIWKMFVAECKLFLREPFALFFTLFFPAILLLIFGTVYGSLEVEKGYHFIDVYVPSLFAMVIANLGLMSIPITMADYRERGILKHYQVTPMPLSVFLTVQIAVQCLMFVLSAIIIIAVGAALFHVRFGGNILLVTAVFVLSMAAMFAVGFAVGGLSSTVRTAQTAGSAVFFVMFFTSGAAIPRNEFPEWLQKVTDYVPLSHVVDSASGLWIGEPAQKYTWSFVLLFGIFLAALAVSAVKFRWQPS